MWKGKRNMGFDIDEAIDDQNWKKESSVSLRFTSENDLDEILSLLFIRRI